MKLWHWIALGGGAWWLLKKKAATAAGPDGAVVGPAPAGSGDSVVLDPTQEPTTLLNVLRTKLDPVLKHKVLSYASGDVHVESWAGATRLATMSFPSLASALEWAKGLPFAKEPAIVNWKFVLP